MIDHVSLAVSDPARSLAFYETALAPLGWKVISRFEGGFGIGSGDGASLWVSGGGPQQPIAHIALRAADHAQVHAFHRAALAAGGQDNGPPGPRAQYSPNYYAAFVLDPDGHNIEAVCHAPG